MEEDDVVTQLLMTCGFTEASAREKVKERLGLESISEFSMLKDTNITDLATTLVKSPKIAERVFMTTKQIMFLQAACNWVRDSKRRGIILEVSDLTGDVLMDIIEKKNFIIKEDQSQVVSPQSLLTWGDGFNGTYYSAIT